MPKLPSLKGRAPLVALRRPDGSWREFQQYSTATPRGVPDVSSEFAHLVTGLKLIEKNRQRIGI